MAWIRHGLAAMSALVVVSFGVVPAASAATAAPTASTILPAPSGDPPGAVRGRVLHPAEPVAFWQPGRHHLGPPRDVTRIR